MEKKRILKSQYFSFIVALIRNSKKVETITIKSTNGDSKTISNLLPGRNHYFRIRSFSRNNGKTKYSVWSHQNKIRIPC